MKAHKKLFIIMSTICALLMTSVIIYTITDKCALNKESYQQAYQKAKMYKKLLEQKESYLSEIKENEAEYKNYFELWRNEALVASNKAAWTSVISRIAADKDVLLRHIDEVDSPSSKTELEVTGDFEAILSWLNSCETHLYGLNVLKSRWTKDTNENAKLYLEIQMYNPEITES